MGRASTTVLVNRPPFGGTLELDYDGWPDPLAALSGTSVALIVTERLANTRMWWPGAMYVSGVSCMYAPVRGSMVGHRRNR